LDRPLLLDGRWVERDTHLEVRDAELRLSANEAMALAGAEVPFDATSGLVLIDERAAERVQLAVDEATRHGARVLHGGAHDGTRMEPTLIEGVNAALELYRDEVFGPVTVLEEFDDVDAAVARANAWGPALQHAVFTDSLEVAVDACHGLTAGGVVVNETSDIRSDQAPFGRSGIGREGVRFAVADMTEPKLVTIVRPARSAAPATR
jgi:acyl-CoA reductase-like NAD-dependent aldehyde dehydrogenase